MKNVALRAVSGIVYVALIVGSIVAGWPFFFALTAIFALLAVTEYNKLFHEPVSAPILLMDSLCAVAIVLLPTFIYGLLYVGLSCLMLIPVYFLFRLVCTLFDMRENAFLNTARSLTGVLYVALPLLALNYIYSIDEQSKWLVLIMFVMIWLNDTGAYCFGVTLGKHRLCERLSPKKSWEGFWGGMGCCVAFGVACYFWINVIGAGVVAWIALGIVVSLFATWGDLFESLLKRSVHVKDSGNLIPGHGGILDRIDSLLFVAPATFIFMVIARMAM